MDFFLDLPRKHLSGRRFSRWLERRRTAGPTGDLRRSRSRALDASANHANDAIALIDLDGNFIDVNDRFLSAYGYRREEIGRMNAGELRPPHLRDEFPALQQKVTAEGGLVYETEHCAKDGRTIPVEISSRLVEMDGERFIQAIIRDISERREAKARILALSRLYAAISAASQSMVRAQSIQEVFDAVCRACVEYGGFRMAWVGLANGAFMIPRAIFGTGTEYLDDMPARRMEAASSEAHAVAYREGRVHACNDFIEDPAAAPWREQAAFFGFRASIAMPLRRAGLIVGALSAYADERNVFDEDMVLLLEDLADTISFGMDHFDRDERRCQAEAALRLNEARLLEAQAIGNIGDWVFDLKERHIEWSPQMYRLFERDPAQGPLCRDEMESYFGRDAILRLRRAVRRALSTRQRIESEHRVVLPSGRESYYLNVIVPIKDGAGRIGMLHGTIQDISARQQAEHERWQFGRRMHRLSQRLIAAQEDERRRLAAELHDRTSPNLAVIQATLATVRQSLPERAIAVLASELDDLRALVEDTASGIRDVCGNLRPAMLDYGGIVPALENHVQRLSRRTGLAIRFRHEGLEERLPPDVEALLFRIAQEALTNCVKHARASTVEMVLARRGNATVLAIADDGVGFDPARVGAGERAPGLGLLTMRERAEFAGGRLRLESRPGQGTTITVEIECGRK